jgi:hypothetical protein
LPPLDLLAGLQGFARRRLRAELAEIMRAEREPLSVEQLVHRLFERRQRLNDLIVLSSASIRRKRRLKRQIEALLAEGTFDLTNAATQLRSERGSPNT